MPSSFKPRIISVCGLILALALAGQTSFAESNTTFLVNTGTSNTADYALGLNGTNNVLIVTNGATLANAGNGYIGSNSISDFNRAYVSGEGSRWTNVGSLKVGDYGNNNILYISRTGLVSFGYSYVGMYGNSNSVIVSSGGIWTNEAGGYYTTIGYVNDANKMIVTNGGIAYIGGDGSSDPKIGNFSSADGNELIVTGTGSVVYAGTRITCGYSSHASSIIVSNGGLAVVGDGATGTTWIGRMSSAWENRLIVTGSGSLYSNMSDLVVGLFGNTNYLTINNGGRVWSKSACVGQSGSWNSVTVAGMGSVFTGINEIIVGSNGMGNSLAISGGGFFTGTNNLYVGYTSASSNNVVSVSGSGSILSNRWFFSLGSSGGSNTLFISDGGKLGAYAPYVGSAEGADNNLINLTGTNSLIECTQIYIGNISDGNSLMVGNGAMLNATLISLGNNAGADNNRIVAAGNGSVINGDWFYVGSGGVNNRFYVTNGAAIYSSEATVGYYAGSDCNSLRLDGGDSRWISSDFFTVGNSGTSNNLSLYNGGKVVCNNGTIGFQSSATNNAVLVTGLGSCWSNRGTLYVGYTGSVSSLTISNSGDLYAGNIIVGQATASTNNSVAVYNSTMMVTGVYDIIRGTNIFDAGVFQVSTLRMTNTAGKMDFRHGTLKAESTLIANGSSFYIGNGSDAATNLIINNGTHYYANGLGINSNGTLAGSGTVVGTALLGAGGFLSPGESVGTLTISNLGVAGGTYVFEKSAASADLININSTFTFFGSAQLTVLLRDLGGASFVGTNTLIAYGAISGTPAFTIDYGTTGLAGYTITNNTVAKRFELVSPQAPTAPEALAASGITTNSFTANWSASVNATNYFLDVATDSSFTSFVSGHNNLTAGDVVSVIVSGLSPNTAYYYRVRAQGLGGTSANSATITVTTYPLPPTSAPTGVSATKSAYTDRVRITWNAVTNATSYEVWRNTANDSSGASHLSNDPSTTAYEDTTVTVGTTYYYWVKAKNASATSGFSSSDSGYASATVVVPSAPSGVSATKGAYPNKVVISWNTVTNASSYEVWQNTLNDSVTATKFGTEPSLTTYEDTGVTVNTVYYYWLKAKNSAGTSGFSASDMGFASAAGDTRWLPVPGDFDGDALTDPAVYQPLTGTWKTRLSSANYLTVTTPTNFLGGTNWTAVVADFDGDHKADLGAYQAAPGDWLLRFSYANYEAGVYLMAFLGGTNWVGLAADFDGDRLADPTVYDSATANWSVKLSGANYSKLDLANFFGGAGWTAFGADFDGDAIADPAIYKNATGAWSVKLSVSGYTQINLPAGWLGGSVWLVATGDYDGDGLADPAIYNPATGDWNIKLSSAGYTAINLPGFLGGME